MTTVNRFLIVGLPRSRTAWLAALCNTVPGAVCYHEPLATKPDWIAAAGLWRGRGWQHIGISDSGFAFHLPYVMDTYAPRVLIVERAKQEVERSLSRIGVAPSNFCDLAKAEMAGFRDHPRVLTVRFEDLSNGGTIGFCLRHLMPECAVSAEKIAIFQRLNVQPDMGAVWGAVARDRPLAAAIGSHAAAAIEARP